jgi:ABC-type uncharacterized transport system substrate-binding protein
MKAKILVCALLALILPAIHLAEAQQAVKVPLVGYLNQAYRNEEFFIKGLRELGYVNGKNIALIVRTASRRPELLPKLAAELINHKVNIIVAIPWTCAGVNCLRSESLTGVLSDRYPIRGKGLG